MKFVKLKLKENEEVFQRQSLFNEGDELVVFSLEEFLKFKSDLEECLKTALDISKKSLNNKSNNSPSTDALRVNNWIKILEAKVDRLDKTDIQKNLLTFND